MDFSTVHLFVFNNQTKIRGGAVNEKNDFNTKDITSISIGISALIVSKYFIGGVFEKIIVNWIIGVGLICFLFGYIDTNLGKKIMRYVNLSQSIN